MKTEREDRRRRSTTWILALLRVTGAAAAMALWGLACGPGGSESESDGTASSGEVCMSFAQTSESCAIGGPSPGVCPAAPKSWTGAKAAGEACGGATECAGIVCKCEDPAVEWYVGVCACGECAAYEVACAEADDVSCKQLAPP